MRTTRSIGSWPATLVGCIVAVLAPQAGASRIAAGPAPAASAVQAAPQQPRHIQNDETASLRQGIVTAVDERSSRIQVQGVWLDLGATIQLFRSGRSAGLQTLKPGEVIRFAEVPDGSGHRTVHLIYAP